MLAPGGRAIDLGRSKMVRQAVGLAVTVSCGPGNDVVVGAVDAAADCETLLPA